MENKTNKEYLKDLLSDHFEKREVNNLLRMIEEDLQFFGDLSDLEIESIAKRLVAQEPVQYVTGKAAFYGRFFAVDDNVLIPRPETEELVYHALSKIKKLEEGTASVIDIGTGSGIIPITIALEGKSSRVDAIDVSTGALAIAHQNADELEVSVNFHHLDFLDRSTWGNLGQYDIIISNPPYIPNHEKSLMHQNVLDHEPHLALFVEDDQPLIFYERIAEFAKSHLTSNGAVLLECNEYNASDVQSLFIGYTSVEIIEDIQGKDRMVVATL